MTQISAPPATQIALLTPLIDRAKTYVEQAKAPNTRRAYRSDWQHFATWCAAHGLVSLPATPQTVALYLADGAQHYAVATLQRRLAAISQAHQAGRFENPATSIAAREVMKGIRRSLGTAQAQKSPVLTEDLQRMLDRLPAGLAGARDRVLLLLGFAGAFRRSELVALDVADVRISRAGLTITIRRSKTDQEGAGRTIGITPGANKTTCPVRAYQAWLKASGIIDGPIFRPLTKAGTLRMQRLSDKAVALIVKRHAESAGLDPDLFAGHSLRAGLATQAAINGASEHEITKKTGHKSQAMLQRYIRDADLHRDQLTARLGL